MLARYLITAIACLLCALLVYISVQNFQPVPLFVFGSQQDISAGLLLLSGFGAGSFMGFSLWLLKSATLKGQQRKLEWDAQDAKLMASVQSDREKQLEAKITTLEAALKAALKKGS